MLDEARANESLNLRNELTKAKEAILMLADILNETPPEFEEEIIQIPEECKDFNPLDIFESDEDRSFYLKLPVFEEVKEVKEIKDKFDTFKKKLNTCNSREGADQLAEEFFRMANKNNRKSFITSLCNYSKHTQSLPFCARIAASLGSVFKEIPSKITKALQAEFFTLQELNDPTSLEIRVRNLKLLAEFLKFQLVSPSDLLNCFEICLKNFAGENIEISCHLLISCGRYLCRHPISAERMNLLIKRMIRLKHQKKNLPPETETLIEEAVYVCQPKERMKKKKVFPILYEFIKYQFFILNATNVQEIIRNLQCCPMPESEGYLIKSVFKAVKKGMVSNLANISKVLSGLKHTASFASTIILLIDLICEDIICELSANDFRKAQYRILMIKFFGELHCYYIIDHTLVFKMLFTLLTTSTDPFKIKLIWALLDTVKDLLSGNQYKSNLKSFLTEFKAYIESRPGISIELEFIVMDLLEMFRSQKVKPDSVHSARITEKEEEKKTVAESSEESEEDFDKEFQKVIEEETLQARNIETGKEKEIPTIFSDGSSEGYKVLVKKGGKVQAKCVNLPISDPLMRFSEERSKVQAAEREKLSKVVVDLHQRRMLEDNK